MSNENLYARAEASKLLLQKLLEELGSLGITEGNPKITSVITNAIDTISALNTEYYELLEELLKLHKEQLLEHERKSIGGKKRGIQAAICPEAGYTVFQERRFFAMIWIIVQLTEKKFRLNKNKMTLKILKELADAEKHYPKEYLTDNALKVCWSWWNKRSKDQQKSYIDSLKLLSKQVLELC
jgi:hypothetical protein